MSECTIAAVGTHVESSTRLTQAKCPFTWVVSVNYDTLTLRVCSSAHNTGRRRELPMIILTRKSFHCVAVNGKSKAQEACFLCGCLCEKKTNGINYVCMYLPMCTEHVRGAQGAGEERLVPLPSEEGRLGI